MSYLSNEPDFESSCNVDVRKTWTASDHMNCKQHFDIYYTSIDLMIYKRKECYTLEMHGEIAFQIIKYYMKEKWKLNLEVQWRNLLPR